MNKMDIVIKPVFMANDNKYDYAGEEEGAGLYKPVSMEYRFIVDTLRRVFGDDLDFDEKNGLFTLKQMCLQHEIVLRNIYEQSGDMPIYCGSCFLRFEIM